MFKAALVLSFMILTASMATAQCKDGWPADKAKATEQVAIYTDAMKQGNYRGATASILWMYHNAPKWNTKLYIDGCDIYDELADKQADPVKKQVLVDSMLWMYDQRIINCGDEPNVLNRKANAAYKYNVKNKDKVAELLAMYDKVYELNGNNVTSPSLIYYMNVVKANFLYLKNLTDDQILSRYDKVMTAIDHKIKVAQEKGKVDEVTKLKSYKDLSDEILTSMVKVDCDFVKKNMEPKYKQNPNDLDLAKKIFQFMLNGKCTDDPLWLETGELINKTEKDFGLAKNLAVKYLSMGNEAKAEALFKEAQTLAKAPADKAEVLIYLGSIEAKKGNKIGARDLFRQAAAADASNKDAFEKIGDLYYSSFNDCAKKENMGEDRLIYIAAYDQYARAGNAQKMAQARAQFPSVEEIFVLSWKEGEVKSIKCWIGESVTLKTRPKE